VSHVLRYAVSLILGFVESTPEISEELLLLVERDSLDAFE
jgi:hypothetical protein